MLKTQSIIYALNTKLLKLYPTCVFYINKVEKGFRRPSFFIEYITETAVQQSVNVFENTIAINVMYFGNVDKYGNPFFNEQQEVIASIKKLLSKGHLEVEDRFIELSYNVGFNDNEVLLNIVFKYTDEISREIEKSEIVQGIEINYQI